MALSLAETESVSAGLRRRSRSHSLYPHWFYLPAAIIFGVLYLLPTLAALYFSLTRWSLYDATFIGFDNFAQFFREPFLIQGVINTLIFATTTSAAKTVIGLLLAMLLTSPVLGRGYLRAVVFFPTLVSTVGVGITFEVMMHPTQGVINQALATLGIEGPGWLVDPRLALYSIILVEVWKGVGIATVIFMAGLVSIPREYYEAATVDGANGWQRARRITLRLVWPATGSVIILSLLGGLRTFDLIMTMTGGGPGFASDVISSIVYKQYQAGFYGLSAAGNVVMTVLIAAIGIPLYAAIRSREVDR